MKRTYLIGLILLSFFAFDLQAQNTKSPKSSSEETIGDLNVKINYSAPSVRGRKIWGDLVPYDKVWRTGADNATTVQFNKDVTVEGQALKAGKYALFTIPGEKEWTVIFNNNPDQWGAYKYDESLDAIRVKAQPKEYQMTEQLLIDVDPNGIISISWDRMRVEVQVSQTKSE